MSDLLRLVERKAVPAQRPHLDAPSGDQAKCRRTATWQLAYRSALRTSYCRPMMFTTGGNASSSAGIRTSTTRPLILTARMVCRRVGAVPAVSIAASSPGPCKQAALILWLISAGRPWAYAGCDGLRPSSASQAMRRSARPAALTRQ